MIQSLRLWVIKKLAGDMTVVLNAELHGTYELNIRNKQHKSLVADCTFDGFHTAVRI